MKYFCFFSKSFII